MSHQSQSLLRLCRKSVLGFVCQSRPLRCRTFIAEEGGFMFIETYYDDRATVPGSTSEPMIPYPELSGEELEVWRKYLPMRRQIRNLDSRLNRDTIPGPVITELEKARKEPRLFDRVEIWSRADDPMAVGIIGEEKTRYFAIARWGDAELTFEQVKKRLRAEKWMLWLASTVGILVFLAATLVAIANGGLRNGDDA